MQVQYKTRNFSEQEDGFYSGITYIGSYEDMLSLQSENPPKSIFYPEGDRSIGGRVKSARVYQENGPLWCCEFQFVANQHHDSVTAPDTTFGKKSATLECGMLSMPLEAHPEYRVRWNHYLAGLGTTAVPSWWSNAVSQIISGDDAQKYRWVSTPAELPYSDVDGKKWQIVAKPSKEGVTSYEVATYVIKEIVRCKSATAAGKICANKANKITTPENNFGIKDGNWKCDGVSVRWSGKYWLAELTYTRSGNSKGWDTELYSEEL